MNKIPNSVSIGLNQRLDQNKLNEINSFKTSLKPNERVRIGFGDTGNEVVFSRHTESNREKSLRQIGNLITKFKNSTAINRNLILLNAKADHVKDWAPDLSSIHSHVSKKFHASEKISLSSSNFQSLINPLANELAVPNFEKLQKPEIKNELKNLRFQNNTNPTKSPEVTYMAGPGEKFTKVSDEFRSFFNFAKDQADGKGNTYRDKKAVDFASRWVSFQKNDADSMKLLFGEQKFNAISHAAAELLAFMTPDKS
jgi:hypothetical protein